MASPRRSAPAAGARKIRFLVMAVADAAPEGKSAAHVVTRTRGGRGAVREVVEMILRAQGVWERTVDAYVQDHGGQPLSWR
jgi:3-deoxy-D-manno-octulosonate 8-phosphate phosphatase KdsC-like HAD superfamily phosphatase